MVHYLLSVAVVVGVDGNLEVEASDNNGRFSDEERFTDGEVATDEVFNTVVFTMDEFNRLISPCPLRLTSGLVVVPKTLNASVTEILDATVLVTGLLGIILLVLFDATLLAVTTRAALFGITLFEATGCVVKGLVALGNGFNTRLLVVGSKGDDA